MENRPSKKPMVSIPAMAAFEEELRSKRLRKRIAKRLLFAAALVGGVIIINKAAKEPEEN